VFDPQAEIGNLPAKPEQGQELLPVQGGDDQQSIKGGISRKLCTCCSIGVTMRFSYA
jgi:hypothetical protein